MIVILTKDVKGTGKAGEVVKVATVTPEICLFLKGWLKKRRKAI